MIGLHFRAVVVSLFVFGAAFPAFAASQVCLIDQSNVQFQVAYAHHFPDTRAQTLLLRVSPASGLPRGSDILKSIGCAIKEKYPGERRWHALVFSSYEAAKRYVPPLPYPNEYQPPEYLGSCWLYRDEGSGDMQCEPSPAMPPASISIRAIESIVHAGDDVGIEISLTNNLDRDLNVGTLIDDEIGVDPNFTYDIRDKTGKPIPPRRFDPSREVTGKGILGSLKRGTSGIFREPISRLYDLTQPGEYTIQVSRTVYEDPAKRVVTSNRITVTVIPKGSKGS